MVKYQLLRFTLAIFLVSTVLSETPGILRNRKARQSNLKTRTDLRQQVANSIRVSTNALDEEIKFVSQLPENDIRVAFGSSSAAHFRFFQSSDEANRLGVKAMKGIAASREFAEKLQLTPEETVNQLTEISLLETPLADTCLVKPKCRPSKYRTIEGSCNNLKQPLWGKSLTPMQRIVHAQYADGVYDPRRSVDGSPLPSARLVSQSLIPDFDSPDGQLALVTMTFAQFTDHDFNLAPVFTTPNGSGIECCTERGDFLPKSRRHPRCLPIEIPADDPFYGPLGRRCMNVVRSIPGPRPDCTFGYAEQMTELTHWVDGSQIYGSTDERSRKLRAFNRGRMLTSTVGSRESLPLDPRPPADCGTPCLFGGDVRVTENQLLTSMHTIWMREHNRVAAELEVFNPHWDDETLFQEARRIVIAELQHIVYNEHLRIFLGPTYLKTYNLITRNTLSSDYDPNINPSINNEFAAAAYRVGHTLLQGVIKLFLNDRVVDSTTTLSSILQNSQPYTRPGFLDRILRSLLDQPIQTFDKAVTSEVTTKLFRGNLPFGMDLVALNTQRAREHGIPGYNAYREVCGLPKAKTFEDLAPVIPPHVIQIFKKLYKSVDDIDLFVAGLQEARLPDALVGRTFNCIIGDQFARLKKGDRYFYDLGGQPHSFRPDQLAEIRKASLSRIICDNNDGTVSSVQIFAQHLESPDNPKVPCDSPLIPRLDLSLWAGEPVF